MTLRWYNGIISLTMDGLMTDERIITWDIFKRYCRYNNGLFCWECSMPCYKENCRVIEKLDKPTSIQIIAPQGKERHNV